jgi:hypothetical protein
MSVKQGIGSYPTNRNPEGLQLREITKSDLAARLNNMVGRAWADSRDFKELVAQCSVNLD